MNCLIVDDEKPNRDGLRFMLQKSCPDISFIYEADSAQAARSLLHQEKIDILFLDINMPNENGFEFLNSLNGATFCVVFVTAYSEFAIRAFKANAIDYLLKPVETTELQEAVEKCKERKNILLTDVASEHIYRDSLLNLSSVTGQNKYPSRLTLPHQQGFNIVDTSEIVCIEADGNYSMLFFIDRENLLVTRAIREFEFLLDPSIFMRSHKSALINLNYVIEYSSADGHFALMKNGKKVNISRRKLDEFMTTIDKLSRRI
jgi:two-component system, LytTR family, response regulator